MQSGKGIPQGEASQKGRKQSTAFSLPGKPSGWSVSVKEFSKNRCGIAMKLDNHLDVRI